MTVATPPAPHRLTWEAFLELPEEQLHNAELHDGVMVHMASPERRRQLWLVDVEEALIMVMRPGPVDAEWAEGDTIETPVLPGFTADVATVLASAR